MLAELHCLWTGQPLRWSERLCLTSMVAHGHSVTLWTYEDVKNVPLGVITADAERILPRKRIIRHAQTQSLALFSNRFRYALLRQRNVTWVDSDVLFLRPLDHSDQILFGLQDNDSICGAVLRLPKDHPALRKLQRLSMARVPVPFWWSKEQRRRQWVGALTGKYTKPEDMVWGTFGPKATTAVANRYGIFHLAKPREVFYPIHHMSADMIFQPAETVAQYLRPETIAVHLWHNKSVEKFMQRPPAGSWIGDFCLQYDI